MWLVLALLACDPSAEVVDSAGTCGDGVVDPGEACDGGAGQCGCTAACTLPAAGDACDDGDPCTTDDACDGAGGCGGAPVTCDDDDPCTVDTCTQDGCVYAPFDGTGPELYDMAALTDPSTLDVEVLRSWTDWGQVPAVDVREIRYTSYESEACVRSPVRIEAFVALPRWASASTPAPGLVVAHGLGGHAEDHSATHPASDLGVAVLAYSGPGQGNSEGTGSTSDHLFDTLQDPRDSWFWEHAVAAIRGLTVLEHLPEVDPDRLGMTGFSAGGVATLTVNGVDARLKAAIPVSASGYLDAAATNPTPGWERDLLAAMDPPRDPSSPEWAAFERFLDPSNYLATAHAPTMEIVGAQDEFFPLISSTPTFAALQAAQPASRLYVVPNYDHGWFALFSGDAAATEADSLLAWWADRWLGDLGVDLPQPTATAGTATCTASGVPYTCTRITASAPVPGPYRVIDSRFWLTTDGLTLVDLELTDLGGGHSSGEVPLLDLDADGHHAWWVEVTVQLGALGRTYKVSSVPVLTPGFHPTILGIAGPLPD